MLNFTRIKNMTPNVLQGFHPNFPSILIFEHLNPFLRFWKSPPSLTLPKGTRTSPSPPPSWPGLWGSIISLTPAGRPGHPPLSLSMQNSQNWRTVLVIICFLSKVSTVTLSKSLLVTLSTDTQWWKRFTLLHDFPTRTLIHILKQCKNKKTN